VKLVVDTGVVSASLSRRRRAHLESAVAKVGGNQVFLAVQTVAELRYGALVAGWGEPRRTRLENAIDSATVVPVTDALSTRVAHLRFSCRQAGHALADRAHHSDLWIAATAIHIGAHLLTADGVFDNTPGLTLA